MFTFLRFEHWRLSEALHCKPLSDEPVLLAVPSKAECGHCGKLVTAKRNSCAERKLQPADAKGIRASGKADIGSLTANIVAFEPESSPNWLHIGP